MRYLSTTKLTATPAFQLMRDFALDESSSGPSEDDSSIPVVKPMAAAGLVKAMTPVAHAGPRDRMGSSGVVDQVVEKVVELGTQAWVHLQTPEWSTAAAGVSAATLAGAITHHLLVQEAQVVPVVYSQLENVTEPSDAVRFFAAVNDMVMSVTDA